MKKNVLLIAALAGAEHCARALEQEIDATVEVVEDRAAALKALQSRSYALLIVEEHLVEGDLFWADRVWAAAGLAVPLQINFALSGCARLIREAKGALARQLTEQELARRAALLGIHKELNAAVTGLLLESELALRVDDVPPALEPRLRHMVELAGQLRERLRDTQTPATPKR